MKIWFILLIPVLISFHVYAEEQGLPAVKNTFINMNSMNFSGKTLAEIIPQDQVKLIALTRNRGKGSTLSKDFTVDWDSDELIKKIFSSNTKASDRTMSSMETTYAEYSIVTKEGDLFILHVIGNFSKQESVSAILVSGDGFGCRFDMNEN